MKSITKEWVEKAEGDLSVAIREMKARKPVYDAVCFLAQQCIEKYLKALILEQGKVPPKTHDLVLLLNLISKKELFIQEKDKLSAMQSYAVAFRYPGEKATKANASNAVETAEKIRSVSRKILRIANKK